jgi:hypothetical protein
MIKYLVAPTQEQGLAEAWARGWTQIAANRVITPEKDDIRIIRRATDLIPYRGERALIIRSADYEDGPPIPDETAASETYRQGLMDDWIKQKTEFDAFVEAGHGEWVEG